jgi:hypothetical protein
MGHIRLPHLPRTKRWQEVVDLVGGGAGSAAAVASATLDAIDDSFASGGDDAGLVRAVWLLANLPDAAKSGDFAKALSGLGVKVSANPSVAEVTTAISDAVDTYLGAHRGRSDIGEMALGAAVEALSKNLAQRTASLFPEADDVRREVAKLGTEVQFGNLARDFFARFTERSLKYYVDRELPRQVGGDGRFQTLSEQREFSRALELHCQQAAKIVEAFAGGWWSKARFEKDLTEERTARFVGYALKKMRDELRKGAAG